MVHYVKYHHCSSSDSIFVDGFDPIHRIEKVHQSGVDAMIAIPASGDDICILTCGDDAALCYTRLRCGISDSMEDVDQFKGPRHCEFASPFVPNFTL